ncbi:MauE/DoxX family redox-associated membrane protein [Lacipirellula parvula]|uniref:MauE/DoxX family redox-associated membrane protein n=1 Tax=Lacipirellula parvula TaxID=2650471 RepID=UPI001260D3C9|nr:MauE/DoxX family redox-associated membrane protein [Lacipirellula parvula]
MEITDLPSEPAVRESTAVIFVRLTIGSLLFATAAMKIISPAESATLAVAYRIPSLLTATVVHVELAIAALLIFGCWTRKTLATSAVMFGVFGAFSIYRGSMGYESCGCFGSLQVNPWITATLDGLMLLLAAWGAWKSTPSRRKAMPPRLYRASGVYALAALLAAGVLNSPPPPGGRFP